MNVALGKHFEAFIADAVENGRFNNASEVIRAGLRLVEERETKIRALRETLQASIAEGGHHSDAEVKSEIAAHLDEWEAGGK